MSKWMMWALIAAAAYVLWHEMTGVAPGTLGPLPQGYHYRWFGGSIFTSTVSNAGVPV